MFKYNVALSKENSNVNISAFIKRLKKTQAFLKNQYKLSIVTDNKTYIQQILFDNYYIIENKIKVLIKNNSDIELYTSNGYLPQIGHAILTNCKGNILPSTDEICDLISKIQAGRYIPNDEFEHIEWAYSYSIIIEISGIFFRQENESTEILNLISLLTKSDTIVVEEIILKKNSLELLYSSEPLGIYPKMDEATRRIYRERTSYAARKSKKTELELGEKFLGAAAQAFNNNLSECESHVGYYIFNEYKKYNKTITSRAYIVVLTIIPIIFSLVIAVLLKSWWVCFLIFFPLWEISKPFVDFFVSIKKEPTYFPRMNLNGEIPDNAQTAIVISTILTSPKETLQTKEKLKKLFFLNQTSNLKYCLLCDFKPSKLPKMPDDISLTKCVKKIIDDLNEEYGDHFISIIRERTYSKTEEKFIGFERKRGAIAQFVSIIKGEKVSGLKLIGRNTSIENIKYIAALDYDTKPLLDSIAELVSVALHPLNSPIVVNGVTTKGYGIFTPKISTKLSSSLKTPFARLFGGLGSSSAYDSLCGNLYQDCFGESIFSGKGLINVDLFYELCCNYFPIEQILSHDILEGNLMRTAFVGDVEFRDNFPLTAMSYFKRLHRWIRGDIQNAQYMCKNVDSLAGKSINKFSQFGKFKIFDNIRRCITPVLIFLLVILCFFVRYNITKSFLAIAVLAILTPFIIGIVASVITNGYFSISRKYYSSAISETKSLAAQGFYAFMLLPQLAIVSLDAVIRAGFRKLISHKKLLEWTTSAQADTKVYTNLKVVSYYIIAEILSILLIFSPYPVTRLIGLVWSFMPVLVYFSDKQYKQKSVSITTDKRASLSSDLSAMWQFYEDYAVENENFLPPDNVQYAPVHRICHRTSPTNIGMMMLSALAARDFDILSTDGLVKRISRTLKSIEKLDKYHGNLYNWYDTDTLKLSSNPYVSAVDSGNLVCCMVTLKEGLKEFQWENPQIKDLIIRIEKLIDETDLSIFYSKIKNLFAIGIDPETDKLSYSHYDMLMSESRMLSYYAIAKRIVPKKHWKNLSRTMKRSGNYAGCVSFSGTFFEFFMPELLLKSKFGSLLYESLRYCIFCQKERAKEVGLPFGVSESGYYSFDNNLNYQYKANGIQKNGLRKGLNNDYIISPYSSYLALQVDINSAYANLNKLKKYGTMGAHGHYEAIDFTQDKKSGVIIKSYMAHHVGMSILSISNTLNDGIMQKRFLSDNYMNSASELLEEKVISGSVIFEDLHEKNAEIPVRCKNKSNEYFDKFYISQPNVKLLSNGEYSTAISDLGATISIYQGIDIYARTADLLRRPQGCYFAVSEDKKINYFTYLPNYINNAEQSVEFFDNEVNFYSNTKELEMGMRVLLHKNLPCEFRQFAVKNLTQVQKDISLLCYIEPVLMKQNDYTAHPAFTKLFIKIEFDEDNQIIFISRKERNSDKQLFCGIGFTQGEGFIHNFSREDVAAGPMSASQMFENSKTVENNSNHIPDPCVFIKKNIELSSKEQRNITLFICSALSKDELYQSIAIIRHEKIFSYENLPSPIIPSSIEGRVATSILPQILFKKRDSTENDQAIAKNTLTINRLWEFAVSGDLPIVVVEAFVLMDDDRISSYIKAYKALRLCGINFDLIFIYEESADYDTPFKNMLKNQIRKTQTESSIDAFGGIHLINLMNQPEEIKTLITALAVHIAPKAMIRFGTPTSQFVPVRISGVNIPAKTDIPKNKAWYLSDNSVTINKQPQVPWCHILSNPVFGTLLSNSSLGFTYAVNSRENKLTPWINDIKTDNRGELLLLKFDDKCFDLVLGSKANFEADKAVYSSETEFFRSSAVVDISKTGCCKRITLELEWLSGEKNCRIAYYTEPVLAVTRENSRLIIPELYENALLLKNMARSDISGYMALTSSEKFTATTNREAFLNGNFDDTTISPQNHLCGAVVVQKNLRKKNKIKIIFYLSFGADKSSALQMSGIFDEGSYNLTNKISIETPDENLNRIFNVWLYHQALVGRIYARTGFYQNSGAFGFRDQLQDSCAVVLQNPEVTKRQIYRACTAQFEEGDVLHWWHKLPSKVMRGVRTRYSDDLLWLPYTVCEYIEKTSDKSILSKNIAYCAAPLLKENQHENYINVEKSSVIESVYNHCIKAIEHSLSLIGEHKLLLMGGGDWNDGYNGVGIEGKGESVWLSQFMIIVLERFSKICESVGEQNLSLKYQSIAMELRDNIENSCWDGEWYLRAFFDNGKTLGSHLNEECKIDSLTQSFAVLSDLTNKSRNSVALQNAYDRLVDEKNGIIKLFEPPFGGNETAVGYVSSYPPGIRENGGQYTHGAVWLCIALLQNGENEKGYNLIKMLNPTSKYAENDMAGAYRNEPYYISADIYTNPQCYGHGGWSIYTGAASWYYRAIFEWLLGIKISNDEITVKPCIPSLWDGFKANLDYKNTAISIEVSRGDDCGISDNGNPCESIKLDGEKHDVRVIIPLNQ